MDESRFDAITRAAATSRRGALKLALAGAIAGLTAIVGERDSRAARRGFPGFNPFSPPEPTCSIDGATVAANTPNPANSCQFCDPGLDANGWSPAFGAFCGDGSQVCCDGDCCPATHCCSLSETCTPCRCDIDAQLYDAGDPHPTSDCLVCDPASSTSSWSPITDGSLCGGVAGRVCCNGECCSPTECCDGIGICTECGPHCRIGGADIDAGTVDPRDECAICDPERSLDDWSPIDDGRACDQGDGCCVAGECGTCSCEIDGELVLNGATNSRNDCEICRYFANPSDWTNRDNNTPCGNDLDRRCCDGECCPSGQCCTLDGCEPCCRIGSETVADGVVNRTNTCQVCDSGRDSGDWTTLGDGETCDPTGNSECCNGECCPSGQCCRNGACGECGCEIGGRNIDPGTINENNPCEICTPALNRFDWSAVSLGASCDANGGTCCGRDCCASELCCLLDACGECLCSIENEIVPPQTPNPEVDCQLCDPKSDPFGWSTAPNGNACGDDGSGSCCNGLCCAEGQCCEGNICRPCGCVIGGIPIPDGEANPSNPCEHCDRALDPGAWSPRNETFACGEGGASICCNGVCCPDGNCCNLDDICEPCRCEIEDVTVEAQTVNPDNRCLFCDPASSTTAWTIGPDYSVCSDPTAEVNRFCCQGICCAERECCRSDGTCGPCTCTIEGEGEFQEGDHNPQNDCEFCNPTDNQTGWSVAPDGDTCGPNQDQTCCAGHCGCETGCTIDGVHFDDGTPNPRNRCQECNEAFPNVWSPRAFPDCPSFCEIDGQIVLSGTLNPANPCQMCRGGDVWSPSTALFCGIEGSRVCCNGVCCESGACCGEEGVCGFDACQQQGCVIDGIQYEDGAIDPTNPCQICLLINSATSWTPRFAACGPTGQQFCCEGVCCDLGACCNSSSVCDFDACETCVIGGELWFPEDRNPANGCEICHANSNKFGWTQLPDHSWCDEMQITTCCADICCDPGFRCGVDRQCVPD